MTQEVLPSFVGCGASLSQGSHNLDARRAIEMVCTKAMQPAAYLAKSDCSLRNYRHYALNMDMYGYIYQSIIYPVSMLSLSRSPQVHTFHVSDSSIRRCDSSSTVIRSVDRPGY